MTLTRTTITATLALSAAVTCCHAFITPTTTSSYTTARIVPPSLSSSSAPSWSRRSSSLIIQSATTDDATVGNLHGQSSCFLPLLQNDEEYIAPRTVQIAGAYPGVDVQTYLSLTSEPSPELGQWTYDFTDPNGPQMGTVALPGMASVYESEDPVVLISDHYTMGVLLPDKLVDPVDLVVLCDRARRYFAERKFLVLQLQGSSEVTIAAFESKGDLPEGCEILGHVTFVQIPWLPAMQKKKSGFMEEDTLFS